MVGAIRSAPSWMAETTGLGLVRSPSEGDAARSTVASGPHRFTPPQSPSPSTIEIRGLPSLWTLVCASSLLGQPLGQDSGLTVIHVLGGGQQRELVVRRQVSQMLGRLTVPRVA